MARRARLSCVLILALAALPCACAGAELDEPAPSGDVAPPAAPAPTATPAATPAAPVAREPAPISNDPRWHPRLAAIAAHYERWGRVDDTQRWAPFLCKLPPPPRGRLSASADETTHGKKLFTLYAMDPEAYGAPKGYASPDPIAALAGVEQVVVKEAFVPKRIDADAAKAMNAFKGDDHGLRPASDGKALYTSGARAGLYVMLKLDAATPGTDEGWVYGTIAPDLTTVTAAGRLAPCMGCHESAPRGRLFGVEIDTTLR